MDVVINVESLTVMDKLVSNAHNWSGSGGSQDSAGCHNFTYGGNILADQST